MLIEVPDIIVMMMSVYTFSVKSTVAGETVLRGEFCCKVSRRGSGNECGSAT